MIAPRRVESDEHLMHRYWLAKIRDEAAAAEANRNTIVCSQETSGVFFWAEQTPEERQMVKEYLVRQGLADWAVKRV